jgi:NADH-quinone oxidoreductase subunit G
MPQSTQAKVRIRVDGTEYQVPAGTTILQALDQLGVLMNGVDVPHYCWHPKLSIDGSCRLCQVEVRSGGESEGRLAIACNTPVADAMVVETKSEIVRNAREGVMEMLLVNHPLDCPICDQAGECKLQDYAFAYGVDEARTREPRRALKKRVDLGETIVFDQERCILCRRCVRFCREVPGTGELGVFDRGDRSVLETFEGIPLDNDYSMNVADICPVGALTTKDFRFKMRVWFLEDADGICTGCSRGCNVHVGVAKNEVQRYVPRRNDAVNDTWMCDAGRLSYKEVARPDRLTRCRVRRDGDGLVPTSVAEGVDAAAARIRALVAEKGTGVVAGVASAHASNEDLFAFKKFLDAGGIDLIGLAVEHGDSDELLVEPEKGANAAGARALGFGDVSLIVERIRGGGLEGLIVLGHDLVAEEYLGETVALERLDTVIHLDTHPSAMERVADVVFPIRHAVEKDATYTNSARRVQRVVAGVTPAPDVLDAGDVFTRLGVAMSLPGMGMGDGAAWDPGEASRRLAAAVPAFAGIDIDSVGREGRVLDGDAE